MSAEMQPWPRPHFTPGGGDALLFWVVFGEFDLARPFGRSKYRSDGPGEWLDLHHLNRAEHGDKIAEYHTGEMWSLLARDAPVTAEQSVSAPEAVVLRAEVNDPPTLDYFRNAVGVVSWLLDAGGIAIYDPQRLWLWDTDEWRSDVFRTEPRPQEHTVILFSDDDSAAWVHTRGMRQYGRPDLSVHGVGPRQFDAVTNLLERFIDFQAQGGVIAEGQEIRLKTLPTGGVCRHKGSLDDPDFNNVHVSIEWPAGALR